MFGDIFFTVDLLDAEEEGIVAEIVRESLPRDSAGAYGAFLHIFEEII